MCMLEQMLRIMGGLYKVISNLLNKFIYIFGCTGGRIAKHGTSDRSLLCMFCICSVYVLCMFRVCSVYVSCKFRVCSVYVLCIFRVHSVYVLCMFPQ